MRHRILIFVFAAIACSLASACRSTIGGGQAKAGVVTTQLSNAENELDSLSESVERSNATPEQKAKMKTQITSIKTNVSTAKPIVNQIGKDADHNQQHALSNEAKAKAFNLIVAFVSLAAIGLGIWFFKSRK